MGTEVDVAQAARLFSQAAEQNNAAARSMLGWCYEHCLGIGQDASAAVEQYRLAAEGGFAAANASLGLCFEKGRGVPRSDPSEDARLYALAAEGGASGEVAFTVAAAALPDPGLPPAAASVLTWHAMYWLNLATRLGHVAAKQLLQDFTCCREVVSACCVGCGAVRKLKTCSRCRVARFCDKECTARMWPAHKASCKAWRVESTGSGIAS
jgi:TPR repeat protein